MENCGQQLVEKPDDVFRMMGEGDKLRHVGATNMNEMSSRSHAIATLVSALCGMFVVLLTARRHSSCRIIFGLYIISALGQKWCCCCKKSIATTCQSCELQTT